MVKKVVSFEAHPAFKPEPGAHLSLDMPAGNKRYIAIDSRLASMLQAAVSAVVNENLTGLVNDAFATFVEQKLKGCKLGFEAKEGDDDGG